ncbi:hypothetical protein CWI38_0015p0070 [Hamiltosporidium tvaerminnensis]|uniref:Uncharacterized protein n=1 Tax=Hamiltosporidium tvaerminnensis TaxID=1176355 RepID=A0A4Q9M2D1_9MICR|nr:hypothetical protein CWI38_0015p0070 [Hamiltosporidium tvaerminnensis]
MASQSNLEEGENNQNSFKIDKFNTGKWKSVSREWQETIEIKNTKKSTESTETLAHSVFRVESGSKDGAKPEQRNVDTSDLETMIDKKLKKLGIYDRFDNETQRRTNICKKEPECSCTKPNVKSKTTGNDGIRELKNQQSNMPTATKKTGDNLNDKVSALEKVEINSGSKEGSDNKKDGIFFTKEKEKLMSQDYEKIKIHKRDIIGSRKVNSSINDFDYVLSKENPYDSEPSILYKVIKKETDETFTSQNPETLHPNTEKSIEKNELQITDVSKSNIGGLTSQRKSTNEASLSNSENDRRYSLENESIFEAEKDEKIPYRGSEIESKAELKLKNDNLKGFEFLVREKQTDYLEKRDQIEKDRFDHARNQQKSSKKINTCYDTQEQSPHAPEQRSEVLNIKAMDSNKKNERYFTNDPRRLQETYKDWLKEIYGDYYVRKKRTPAFPRSRFQIPKILEQEPRGSYTESTTEVEVVEKHTVKRIIESSVFPPPNNTEECPNKSNRDKNSSIFDNDLFFRESREIIDKIRKDASKILGENKEENSEKPVTKSETLEEEVSKILEKYHLKPKLDQDNKSPNDGEKLEVDLVSNPKKSINEILERQKSEPVLIKVKEECIESKTPILVAEKQEKEQKEEIKGEKCMRTIEGQENYGNTEPSNPKYASENDLSRLKPILECDKQCSSSIMCGGRHIMVENTGKEQKSGFKFEEKAISSPDLSKNKTKVKEKEDKQKKKCVIS